MEEDFLTVKEFASLMRMHYNSIIRSIKNGRIQAFRVGIGKKSTFRIPRSEVHRIGVVDLQKVVDRLVEEKIANIEKNKDYFI